MPTARYRPDVEGDLRDAANWYEEKRSGLGDEFTAEFWATMDKVEERPQSHAITSTGLRACRMSRFPYVIHFQYEDEELVVFAVMHDRRDSSAWIDRL